LLLVSNDVVRPWEDKAKAPSERAQALVAAMSLEQKIAQLHGVMETIDIYAITADALESGADMDQLAAQIQIERHVQAIDELGIPQFRITNGPASRSAIEANGKLSTSTYPRATSAALIARRPRWRNGCNSG
jgi:hypothetical protein